MCWREYLPTWVAETNAKMRGVVEHRLECHGGLACDCDQAREGRPLSPSARAFIIGEGSSTLALPQSANQAPGCTL